MKVILDIPAQKIADLMVTAIEGNHMVRAWCDGVFLVTPKSYARSIDINNTSPWYSKKEIYEQSFSISVHEIFDTLGPPKGDNINKHTVGSVQFAEAFRKMAEHSPKQFAEFMTDNYDIITADVFLQYAALGELIYG